MLRCRPAFHAPGEDQRGPRPVPGPRARMAHPAGHSGRGTADPPPRHLPVQCAALHFRQPLHAGRDLLPSFTFSPSWPGTWPAHITTSGSGAGLTGHAIGSTATRPHRRSATSGRRKTTAPKGSANSPEPWRRRRRRDRLSPRRSPLSLSAGGFLAIRRPVERAGRADPLLLRHAGRRLGGVSSTRGDPRTRRISPPSAAPYGRSRSAKPRRIDRTCRRETLTGGPDTWQACQLAARRHREHADGIVAPSAALQPGAAHGWHVDGGLQPGPDRDGQVFALFGRRPDVIGWATTVDGRPSPDLLPRVRHFQPDEPSR